MRDRETIDAELRRIAAMRRSLSGQGGRPWSGRVDELLDERLGHPTEGSEARVATTCETEPAGDLWHEFFESGRPRRRPKSTLRRFFPRAALPLSLLAVAAALVMVFVFRHSGPGAQPQLPTDPPSAQPSPPPSAQPTSDAPKAPAPLADMADTAFVAALTHEGVPVPSRDYAITHGHAVCDFLSQQSNFAAAVRFVQQSTIWDANQSSAVAAGAVVSYCPQYQPANSGEMQQIYQNAESNLEKIERDLQGIRDDLSAIPGR